MLHRDNYSILLYERLYHNKKSLSEKYHIEVSHISCKGI